MSDLFGVNAPIKWGEPKPMTRADFQRAWKHYRAECERAREQPLIWYVHPREFEEYVALGICDKDGRPL